MLKEKRDAGRRLALSRQEGLSATGLVLFGAPRLTPRISRGRPEGRSTSMRRSQGVMRCEPLDSRQEPEKLEQTKKCMT
jgi:hypothetical protein